MAKKPRWPELGIITKNTVKDKEGKPVLDKQGNPVTRLGFKLADNVTLLVDGKPVDVSQYGVLTTPVDEVERLYKNGAIGDDKIEERRQAAKDAHSWLRYKIQMPPAQDSKE